MKLKLLTLITVLVPVLVFASVANPIADFKRGLTIPAGDRILKWVCDVNGDGKNEVFLCLKSDFDKAVQDHEPPSWSAYIAEATGNGYLQSTGIESEPETIDGILPAIDPDACFVGQIAEVRKRGIVATSYATQRSGITTATIYAYSIENDHLKRTQLAQYDPDKGSNAVFDKYLSDVKRTHVTLQEVTP